jgi:hypothetical protein
MDQKRLEELRDLMEPGAPSYDGMPGGATDSHGKPERLAADIVDLEAVIAAKQIQCIHERARLERYIADIPDSLTRQIFQLRYVQGETWDQVARSIGGITSDSAKKTCYRYLQAGEA